MMLALRPGESSRARIIAMVAGLGARSCPGIAGRRRPLLEVRQRGDPERVGVSPLRSIVPSESEKASTAIRRSTLSSMSTSTSQSDSHGLPLPALELTPDATRVASTARCRSRNAAASAASNFRRWIGFRVPARGRQGGEGRLTVASRGDARSRLHVEPADSRCRSAPPA